MRPALLLLPFLVLASATHWWLAASIGTDRVAAGDASDSIERSWAGSADRRLSLRERTHFRGAKGDDRGRVVQTDPRPKEPVEASKRTTFPFADGPLPATDLVPADGFDVTMFAGDDLVHDAGCLTTADDGRIAVSGPGYIRLLVDHDRDGRADVALPFADGPRSGAQGLCFDGDDLLAVGDGGLLRYRDRDRDGRADAPPTVLLRLKTGGEHHAHAVRPGPDGWWYLICGNDTGVSASTISSPHSPIRRPQAGVLLRFRYESHFDAVRDVEVVADGLRNAYDFDFTRDGDAVTFDSDDEREVSLPWYRPTRVFRLAPGSHAGWMSRSWKRPDAFPEMPAVLARLGRGSPTGVLIDRNGVLPPPFRGSILVCDWTFGRIVAIPPGDDGRAEEPRLLLSAASEAGFAPTDLDFSLDGSILIAAGGRGTTGTVYRLRPSRPVDAVQAETPSSLAWMARRTTLERLAESLSRQAGRLDSRTLESVVLPALSDDEPDVRKAAMHVVGRLSPESTDELDRLATAAGPAAAIRFHLGRLRRTSSVDLVALETAVEVVASQDEAPGVRYDAVRLAQLALGDLGPEAGMPDTFAGYSARIDLDEWRRPVEPLAERLAAVFPTDDDDVDRELLRLLAMLEANDPRLPRRIVERITPASHPTDDLHHLFVLSRLKLARGSSVWPGSDLSERRPAIRQERNFPRGFPSPWGEGSGVRGRLAATLSLVAELVSVPTAGFIESERSRVPLPMKSEINNAGELPSPPAPLPRERGELLALLKLERAAVITHRVAEALVALDAKCAARGLNVDNNWDDRLGDLVAALTDADGRLAEAIVDHRDFGRPAHAVLAGRFPASLRNAAAQAFLNAAEGDSEYRWTSEIVALLAESHDPALRERLRSLVDEPAVRDDVLLALTTPPDAADRERYVEGLGRPQIELVEACVVALEALPPATEPAEIASIAIAVRRLRRDDREYAVRQKLVGLLQRAAGRDFGFVPGKEGYLPQNEAVDVMIAYARTIAPDHVPSQPQADTALAAALVEAGQLSGDAQRGRLFYESRACHRCHDGGAVGPDLAGVAGRFSRNDLFAAIALPDRDVSERYRGTQILTTSGQTLTGLVVYESADGVTLKDGTHTWRVEADEIELRQPIDVSLMPRGLLNDAAPRDLADLEAYLRSPTK